MVWVNTLVSVGAASAVADGELGERLQTQQNNARHFIQRLAWAAKL